MTQRQKSHLPTDIITFNVENEVSEDPFTR